MFSTFFWQVENFFAKLKNFLASIDHNATHCHSSNVNISNFMYSVLYHCSNKTMHEHNSAKTDPSISRPPELVQVGTLG